MIATTPFLTIICLDCQAVRNRRACVLLVLPSEQPDPGEGAAGHQRGRRDQYRQGQRDTPAHRRPGRGEL